MSLPEVMLWERLRSSKSGVRIRRQHPLGPYICDFCCAAARLVIEIDGAAHDMGNRPERDSARDRYFAERGYKVLRVAAADVLSGPDRIAEMIALAAHPLHRPADGPPPRAGEDE